MNIFFLTVSLACFGEKISDLKFQYKSKGAYLISLKFMRSGVLKFLLLKDSKLSPFCRDIKLGLENDANEVIKEKETLFTFFDNSKKILKIQVRCEK